MIKQTYDRGHTGHRSRYECNCYSIKFEHPSITIAASSSFSIFVFASLNLEIFLKKSACRRCKDRIKKILD